MLKVDKATTTKAIQKLEHKGFIERVRDQVDKRMWRLFPSPQARDLYVSVMEEENVNIAVCFSGLSKKEEQLAEGLIRRMAQNIECKWGHLKTKSSRDTMKNGGNEHEPN
jgi:DNA-binding MarR family transcriptional regulator